MDLFLLSNEASNTSHSHATACEQVIVAVTNTISFQALADETFFEPTSKSPSIQIDETTTSSTASRFERLFVGTDDVPAPESSSKLSTSPITEADPPESISINVEHSYRDHIGLLKKILTKPLSEISRSQDVDVLLSTLENLKNCPHLNSQQSEIIRYYIEHFDTLVTYQSFYEDQIGRASALQVSLQEDRKQLPELKTLYDNLADKADSLSADKEELNKKLEALKKKLQEVEEEEKQVRADMEVLRDELVTKNMKQDALPKASMRQKEALDKARSADDNWTKLRNLFA